MSSLQRVGRFSLPSLSGTLARAWIPVLFCALGIAGVFGKFLRSGGEWLHGDLADARFNLAIVEHVRLWWQGHHPSLFDVPMFAPHLGVYAYSDFWFSIAPLYAGFRFWGDHFGVRSMDFYGAWEWVQILVSVLNYFCFYFFALELLSPRTWTVRLEGASRLETRLHWIAGATAFGFAFGIARQAHLNHLQLWPQFWIVISAWGLWRWYQDPASRSGATMFFLGAILQFITGFYYLWFWVWALVMGLAVLFWQGRGSLGIPRITLGYGIQERFSLGRWKIWLPPLLVSLLLAAPFLWAYLLSARDGGRQPWVSISHGIPRLYSWIALPENHWQWPLLPFKRWIQELPVQHEHLIGMGIGTSLLLAWAFSQAWSSTQLWARVCTRVLGVLFLFTLTSGRFSTWVFMSYLFPGGGAIRSLTRIQIFMLLVWMLLLALALARKSGKWVALAAILLVAESWWPHAPHYSRTESEARIQAVLAQVPPSCQVLAYEPGFKLGGEAANLDAVFAAWRLGIQTANGYSGRQPPGYAESGSRLAVLFPNQRTCWIP